MATPILATKLYIPPSRPDLVPRRRLIARLHGGLHRKLTLISAPAGFGKTTLVSAWLDERSTAATGQKDIGKRVAWLSVDESDSDPTRFLSYLIAALQTVLPHLGTGLLQLFQSPQPPPVETLLTTLLNEIATLPTACVFVLDDYHLAATAAVNQTLVFLLEHLPPQMHLVITTREDPDLPLARLRTRNQLTEVRAADLRFTPTEAADFLNGIMDLSLSTQEVAALEGRTEGWIAGLQLAALSMRGRTDIPGFISAFAGDNRYIMDYLVAEVLERQPQAIRNFLRRTAMLDRLSGPLCDAVTGQGDGRALLAALERSNLFVVPLDDKRQWYRYHHLFADLLHAHLLTEEPALLPLLHRRASLWHAQNGSLPDAIRHALAAADFARAAELVELAWPAMRKSRQEATVLSWLKALPGNLVRVRPVLSVVYALALLDGGELAAVEGHLRNAERWLEKATPVGEAETERTAPVVADPVQLRLLPAAIANARAYHAQALGDVPNTINHAQRALECLPATEYYERGTAAALLGLAYWTTGELVAAHHSFAEGLMDLQRAGGIDVAIGGTTILAEIQLAQGHLRAALHTYEQAIQLATEQARPLPVATADLHRGLSEIYREWGELEAAAEQLLKSERQGKQTGLPGDRCRWYIAQARLHAARGERERALTLLDEATRFYQRTPIPDVHPIAALKARLWVQLGRLPEAQAWVHHCALSLADEPSYLHEYEQITLARILIAQGKWEQADGVIEQALDLLTRLLQAAEAGARTGSVIEILLLQALAHAAQGDLPSALMPLTRALTLAAPEGYVRLFVDEGPPMAQLLQKATLRALLPALLSAYTNTLLTAFEMGQQRDGDVSPLLSPAVAPQPLVEPLSERELEVLRLFKTTLSGPEIAHELVIALSTVRTHTKNIYSKLNVNNRRAAVQRASDLGLL